MHHLICISHLTLKACSTQNMVLDTEGNINNSIRTEKAAWRSRLNKFNQVDFHHCLKLVIHQISLYPPP